jgi:hypothetical protein
VSATLAAPRQRLHAPPEPTLADVVGTAWAAVSTGAAAECPVCTGSLEPRWSAGSGVVGARCGDCGATLE